MSNSGSCAPVGTGNDSLAQQRPSSLQRSPITITRDDFSSDDSGSDHARSIKRAGHERRYVNVFSKTSWGYLFSSFVLKEILLTGEPESVGHH